MDPYLVCNRQYLNLIKVIIPASTKLVRKLRKRELRIKASPPSCTSNEIRSKHFITNIAVCSTTKGSNTSPLVRNSPSITLANTKPTKVIITSTNTSPSTMSIDRTIGVHCLFFFTRPPDSCSLRPLAPRVWHRSR